jgi:hypothetical protein
MDLEQKTPVTHFFPLLFVPLNNTTYGAFLSTLSFTIGPVAKSESEF